MTSRKRLTHWTGTLVLAVGLAGFLLGAIIPSAHAQDALISSNTPTAFFNDTDITAQTNEWRVRAREAFINNQSDFEIIDEVNANVALQIQGTDNNSGSMIVDANGDIHFANNSVFIDRSADRVGIGTTVPADALHVAGDTSPSLRLEDTDGTPQVWRIESAGIGNSLFFRDITAGTVPFSIEDGAAFSTLVVADTSRVGVGTNAPTAKLEVSDNDGTAQILVDENDGTATSRTLLVLENNGPADMVFTNTDRNVSWNVGIGSNNTFKIEKGNKRLQFFKNGRLRVRVGTTTTFNLGSNGDLDIDGVLTQGSDVNAKAQIVPVDGQEVLTQIAALPVSTWSYKAGEPEVRHLGPTAQDFRAAFGLGGDELHIAPGDMAGVALAAIRALQEQNLALQARVAALEERLAGLN